MLGAETLSPPSGVIPDRWTLHLNGRGSRVDGRPIGVTTAATATVRPGRARRAARTARPWQLRPPTPPLHRRGVPRRLNPCNPARRIPADRSNRRAEIYPSSMGARACDQPLGHAHRVNSAFTRRPDSPLRRLPGGLERRHGGRVHDRLPGSGVRRTVLAQRAGPGHRESRQLGPESVVLRRCGGPQPCGRTFTHARRSDPCERVRRDASASSTNVTVAPARAA